MFNNDDDFLNDTFADPDHCTIEGNNLNSGIVGEIKEFNIISRNKNGDKLDLGGEKFKVELVDINNKSNKLNCSVVDLKNGTYKVQYTPTKIGNYNLNIYLDGNKIKNSPKRPIRILSGETSPNNCTIINGECLKNGNQIEGKNYSFQLQTKDKFGNDRKKGGDNFSFNLYYLIPPEKQVIFQGKQFIKVNNGTNITDFGDGQYNFDYKFPIPGNYVLDLKLHDNQFNVINGSVPPFTQNGIKFEVNQVQAPILDYQFMNQNKKSYVIQFGIVATPPIQNGISSFPRYVSILLKNQINKDLNQGMLSNWFSQQFQKWLIDSRLHSMIKLEQENPINSIFEEPENGNYYWNKIFNIFDVNNLCNDLKNSLDGLGFSNPQNFGEINHVSISDEPVDWSEYERNRNEEENPKKKQMLHPQGLMHPNSFSITPRTSALNFWVLLSKMIQKATAKGGKILDNDQNIYQYKTNEVSFLQFKKPDVLNYITKKDIIDFISIHLQASQRMIFETLNEISEKYKYLKKDFQDVAKQSFDELLQAYKIAETVVNKDNFIPGDIKTKINDKIKNTGKVLVLAMKRKFLYILRDFNISVSKILFTKGFLTKPFIEKLQGQLKFFKKSMNAIYSNYKDCFGYVLSSKPSAIIANEIIFEASPYMHKSLYDPHQKFYTRSYSISIPLNSNFDQFLFKNKKWLRCARDRKRPGLVNGWKTCYVKNGTVMWEGIRSATLTATKVEDKLKRKPINLTNAIELLKAVAVNHCKRFSRMELNCLFENNESLLVPFTTVSLLTPYFVSEREDRIAIDHQEALRLALNCTDIDNVPVDLHDGGGEMVIPIQFKNPCLMNFGVNTVIKTFKLGIGIQRAINCRKNGVRLFEKKVLNFLDEVRIEKSNLRSVVIEYMNSIIDSGRQGMIFKSVLNKEVQRVSNCEKIMLEIQKENQKKIVILDSEMETKQKILEDKIKNEWIHFFEDSGTSVELYYQTKIKSLVNSIIKIHDKIHSIEKKWAEKMDEMQLFEIRFSQECLNILSKAQQGQGLNQSNMGGSQMNGIQYPPKWQEYHESVYKERDLWDLFKDFRDMYHQKTHEKWAQGLIEKTDVLQYDPYSLPVRAIFLSFLIGEQCHINCKSGKDRAGQAVDQCCEFAEMRAQFGQYPGSKTEKKKFNEHRRKIFTNIAMNGCCHDIIKRNIGIRGSKVDTQISGRFLKNVYKEYIGLSGFDELGFATSNNELEKILSALSK